MLKSIKGSAVAEPTQRAATTMHFSLSNAVTKSLHQKNQWTQSHSNQVEGDASLNKEAQTQRIVGVGRIVFTTECDS